MCIVCGYWCAFCMDFDNHFDDPENSYNVN